MFKHSGGFEFFSIYVRCLKTEVQQKDTNFRWSKDKNTVYYSELLDWFRNDFADEEMGLVTYSLTYLDLNTASEISEAEDLKIKYLAYDWSLNGVWD